MATPAAVLNILVNAQTGKAQGELKRFDRQMGGTARSAQRASTSIDRVSPSIVALGGAAGGASRAMRRLVPDLQLTTRVPVYRIVAIGTAIAGIIPPTVALAGALAPVTGLLAAIPGLATSAVQAIGTIALGARGIGDAVKAGLEGQKTASKDAASSLKSQQASAEAVRSAVRGVADARRGLVDANRGVADAERGLSDAQRDAEGAQEDLNAARAQAARDLVDMRLAVRGAMLSEKEARIEVSRAIEEQTNVLSDEESTWLDVREASLAVQQARLGLKEATVEGSRAQKDFNDAQRKGVSGSDRVVSAQEALQDAQRGVADANRGVADANRGVADAQRALVEATRQVRLAQRDQATGAAAATAGMEKYQQAMEGLPAAGRDFVRFLIDLKPRIDALRDVAAEGLLPGVTRGIQAAMGSFQGIKKTIGETSSALGDLAEQAGRRLGSAEWGRDLEVQGERNVATISRLGTATLSLADGLRHVMLAAGPLVGFLTTSAARFAEVFENWAQASRESGKLAAFFQRTIAVTKLTVEALWDFGRALMNIGQIASRVWGDDLLKGINNVAGRFRAWTESVRGSRDIEGYFVRWRQRWANIAEAVQGVFERYRQLRREGEKPLDAGVRALSEAFSRALPQMAESVARQVPRIAEAFVRGFLASDVWGKLVIGGWLIAKFGGFAAFTAIGTKLGAALGLGITTGTAAAVGGAGGGAAAGGGMLAAMRGKLLPMAKRIGLAGVGIALADSVISEMGRRVRAKSPDVQTALAAAMKPTKALGLSRENFIGMKVIQDLGGEGERIEQAMKLKKALESVTNAQKGIGHQRAQELREEIEKLPGASSRAKSAMNQIVDSFERTGQKAQAVRSQIKRMAEGSSGSISQLRTNVKLNTRLIRNALGEDTAAGRRAMSENFRAAIKNVKQSMKEGILTTGEGTREIQRLMTQSLSSMGFTKAQILHIKGSTRSLKGLKPSEVRGDQRGGPIMEGALSGDSVPSVLERGEYVLNRKAVQAVGKSKLDQINFKHAPRFQSGGMVRIPGDPDTTGGRDKVAASIAQAVGSWIKRYKIQVGYAFDPGGGHKSSGHNVTGTALDVVPGIGGSWDTLESGLKAAVAAGKTVYYGTNGVGIPLENHGRGNHGHVEWGGSGGVGGSAPGFKMGKKLERLLVEGPDSMLKANAQGAIDVARQGANRVIDKANQQAGAGGNAGSFAGVDMAGLGAGSAANRALGKRMAAAMGWTGEQWTALDHLWGVDEGHWDENLANMAGSGAYGIAQALPSSKYPPAGQPSAPPGIKKAKAQIGWGLKYIKDRPGYGSPVAAHNFRHAMGWYQKGGSVSYPLAAKGSNLGGPSAHKARALGNWESDNAVDIGVPMGTAVKALSDGKISKIAGSWDGGGGQTSGIQVHFDNANTSWFYTHLKKMAARVGQQLQVGQNFGLSGAGNGVPHLHLGRMSGNPEQALNWPIVNAAAGGGGTAGGGGGGGKGTSGEGGPIKKLAYVGDSIGEQVLKAGLKAKLGKIKLAASASAGKTSSWGVGVLKGLLDKDVGAAMLDMGTNDGTAGNLRPSIDAVEGMLKGRPLMMASLDPQSTDVAKKNAAIRANANVVVPWAGIAQKYAADRVHPTSAGASKKASMIAAAAKRLRTGSKGESGLTDREKKQLKTPLKGSLGKVLTKTLKVLRSNKPAKFRGTRLRQLEKRIQGMDVGLPDGMRKQIANLRAGIEEVGGNADAASSFNVDNEDGTTSLGVIRGKTEAGWVTDQLDMLFRLRNKLIDAKKIVEKHRGEVQKLIERMQKRLQALAEDIRTAAKAKREAEQHLKQLQKHPKQNGAAIKKQKAVIDRIEGNQSDRVRERDAISDKILPALTGKRKQFTTFINENIMGSDGLPQIQGLGSPLEKLTTLPPVGVLLGDIFNAQMRLRELAAPSTSITDSATPETSESAELLKQLLDEANLRTAVSQKQYEVLRNMPPYGGQFATGGVVPGPIGAARTIVAHGGETVTPPGNGSAPNVQVIIGPGMEWLDKYIEVKVDGVTRKQARAGARGLPGRGGGF